MADSSVRELGHAAVDRAGDLLSMLFPELAAKRQGNWWKIGAGPEHFAISYQEGQVSNPRMTGERGQSTPRLSAEAVFDAPASNSGRFDSAFAAADRVHREMGHALTWLPNGNSGEDTKRHTIRSSRPLDASTEDLAHWLVVELLLLRRALAVLD